MKFVWGGKRDGINSELLFEIDSRDADTLEIYAADSYTVCSKGKIISSGPERCAAGYARVRRIDVGALGLIEVRVLSFGVPNYSVDYQLPYFAIRLLRGGEVISETDELECAYIEERRLSNMPRYSAQRAFTQGFDLTREGRKRVALYEVEPPILLDGQIDTCDYPVYEFSRLTEGIFSGFDEIKPHRCMIGQEPPEGEFSLEEGLSRAMSLGYASEELSLKVEKSGYLSFEIDATEEGELFAFFEEYLPEGKWIFRRAGNNDFMYVRYPKGKSRITASEPFTMKLLRTVHTKGAVITPSLVGLENSRAGCVKVSGDERVVRVFEAARNTFMQNAVDVFMDCPGRERAGWLCDSYFTAIAERLFTGKNTIEKAYLENYVYASCPELPFGMLPMCFPSEHRNGRYIPNWAMWFVIELADRVKRTGDRALADAAREKVYGVARFFDKYKNEYGLLEDLESWVFIEWSICNDDEYVKGVNYPSNMLYAYMLDKIDELYGDEKYNAEAENMRKSIVKLAYNGKFFVDNAVRVNGSLKNCEDHLSETCQYYALFMGLEHTSEFERMLIEDFGPLRTDKYPEVGRSNMFIGNYLRFFWLLSLGERERTIRECLEYFDGMATTTGTLWEHDRPTASCNHGFASVAAHILLSAFAGFVTVKDGEALLDPDIKPLEGYDIKVSFDYGV